MSNSWVWLSWFHFMLYLKRILHNLYADALHSFYKHQPKWWTCTIDCNMNRQDNNSNFMRIQTPIIHAWALKFSSLLIYTNRYIRDGSTRMDLGGNRTPKSLKKFTNYTTNFNIIQKLYRLAFQTFFSQLYFRPYTKNPEYVHINSNVG